MEITRTAEVSKKKKRKKRIRMLTGPLEMYMLYKDSQDCTVNTKGRLAKGYPEYNAHIVRNNMKRGMRNTQMESNAKSVANRTISINVEAIGNLRD